MRPDENQGAEGQESGEERRGHRDAADDDCSRRQRHREKATAIEERVLSGEGVPGPGEVEGPRHAEPRPEPLPGAGRVPCGGDDGETVTEMRPDGTQKGPHHQRLSAGVRAVVEAVDRESGVIQREHEGGGGDRPQTGGDRQGPHPPAPDHEERHQGPDQVELLFDGERPGVEERRWCRGLDEVALVRKDEVPVGYVEKGGQGITADRCYVDRMAEHVGVHRDAQDQDNQGREESACPISPESPQLDGRCPSHLPAQERGDQKA